MFFFTIPLKNLIGRPFRSSLTALGVSLAVGSFIALIGLARGVEQAWTRSLEDRDTHILAAGKNSVELLTGSLDQSLAEQFKKVPGVRSVSGELIDLVTLDQGGATVLIAGWPPDSYMWPTLRFTTGRPGGEQEQALVLGHRLAEGLALAVGDELSIRERRFRVAGIFEQGGAMTDSMILMPLFITQQLLNRPGKVTVFNLRLQQPENRGNVNQVKKRLEGLFPNLSFTETREITRNNRILRLLKAIVWSTSAIAVIMGLFIVLNTLLMSVLERTRDVGILRAVGWSAHRVLTMIILEGLLLSLAGSLIGSALGWGSLQWLKELPQVRGFIEPQLTWQLLLEVSGASLLVGILGSLYPAWRAIRLHPVEALRYE